MDFKNQKFAEALKNLASRFITLYSNKTSIITVTGVSMTKDMKKTSILVTVFPEDKEKGALGLLKRKRGEFRNFVKQNLKSRVLSFFDFEIDKGEKNRQRIEELSGDVFDNTEGEQ